MEKIDYKDTLNLPKTEFSMKANLKELEPKILKYWQDIDIYNRLRKIRNKNKKYILHDGPPYANGLIHIGHALNKILKDIIVKFMFMKGLDVPFVVGWDCHGLPVEHQLLKELNLDKSQVDSIDFRKKAKDFALKYVKLQKEDFKRLGVFSNWDNPYLTLSPSYECSVIKLLEYLVERGFIYRGRRPVNWCINCETALAEAEVEYFDKESDSIYVLFKIVEDKNLFNKENVYLLVWTTTPWTLISNVAVAVNPKLDYLLVEFQDKFLVLAKDLIGFLEKKLNTNFKEVKAFKGKELENLIAKHPFLERNSRVVLGDFVSCEEGSGIVHIAPGHGEEDFSLVKKYNLEVIMPVNEKGMFVEPPEFRDKNIQEASQIVLEKLKINNLLLKHEKITHSYPHCWRCKNPIIFRATFQWFLSIDHKNLREKLLDEIEKINWVPNTGKERMRSMLINRPDWCLSRQRLWGVPIPSIRCKNCNEVILDKEIIRKVAEVFKIEGSDSWFTLNLNNFLPNNFSCFKCKSKDFQKEFEILDVWFESGASFFAVLKNHIDLQFPADMYLEGSDQHRGWFQVSLIPSIAIEGIAPFKTILTHGFVVDEKGRKMSKSLGNVISPQDVIKNYGAEILRIWVAFSDYSDDVKISESIISQIVDMYRKIRNTIRFILGNISDFSLEEKRINKEELLELDRYMLSKIMLLHKEVISYYENFSFYKVFQKIFNFCNLELSSFYLDILKDRLYTFSPKSKERLSAQFVLFYILEIVLKLIAPICPFTAEEAYLVWKNLSNKKASIFECLIDEDYFDIDTELLERWDKLLSLRKLVLKEIENEREKKNIGSSLEAKVFIKIPKENYFFYEKYKDILREIFIVSELEINEGEFEIKVEKTKQKKCLRCWNWKDDVMDYENFRQVCYRCFKVLKGGV